MLQGFTYFWGIRIYSNSSAGALREKWRGKESLQKMPSVLSRPVPVASRGERLQASFLEVSKTQR